jgi:hypothetical protein
MIQSYSSPNNAMYFPILTSIVTVIAQRLIFGQTGFTIPINGPFKVIQQPSKVQQRLCPSPTLVTETVKFQP